MKLTEAEIYRILPGKEQETIGKLISDYVPHHLFIRKAGSSGGQTLVDENLESKTLLIQEENDARVFYIDGMKVFRFKLDELGREIDIGSCLYLKGSLSSTKYEPCLRSANFEHYFEVYFARGDVHIERAGENYWVLR